MNTNSSDVNGYVAIRNSYARNYVNVGRDCAAVIVVLTTLQFVSMSAMIFIFLRHYDPSDDIIFRNLAMTLMAVALLAAFVRKVVLKVAGVAVLSSAGSELSVDVKLWVSIMWWGEVFVTGAFFLAVLLGPIMNFRPF